MATSETEQTNISGTNSLDATSYKGNDIDSDGDGVVDDSDQLQGKSFVEHLVDSPNGSFPNAVLDDGESVEITVPVADQETIEVYRWGAYQISDGTTPANLDMELKDGSDTVQTTENTGDTESTDTSNPTASHQNTTGSTSIYKIAIANDTGSTISDPGVSGFAAFRVV